MSERDARYRRKPLILLSSATFFEGYDTFVLAFALAIVAALVLSLLAIGLLTTVRRSADRSP